MSAMSRKIILYNIVTVLANWQPGIYAKSCNTQLSMQVSSQVCVCVCLSGFKCEKPKTVFTGKAHSSQTTSSSFEPSGNKSFLLKIN